MSKTTRVSHVQSGSDLLDCNASFRPIFNTFGYLSQSQVFSLPSSTCADAYKYSILAHGLQYLSMGYGLCIRDPVCHGYTPLVSVHTSSCLRARFLYLATVKNLRVKIPRGCVRSIGKLDFYILSCQCNLTYAYVKIFPRGWSVRYNHFLKVLIPYRYSFLLNSQSAYPLQVKAS